MVSTWALIMGAEGEGGGSWVVGRTRRVGVTEGVNTSNRDVLVAVGTSTRVAVAVGVSLGVALGKPAWMVSATCVPTRFRSGDGLAC